MGFIVGSGCCALSLPFAAGGGRREEESDGRKARLAILCVLRRCVAPDTAAARRGGPGAVRGLGLREGIVLGGGFQPPFLLPCPQASLKRVPKFPTSHVVLKGYPILKQQR